MAESTSAMPPKHHAHHGKMAGHHRGKAPQLTADTANQLNQEELARLQSGNFSNPPVVPSNPSDFRGPDVWRRAGDIGIAALTERRKPAAIAICLIIT
jgi:hypothetical protein